MALAVDLVKVWIQVICFTSFDGTREPDIPMCRMLFSIWTKPSETLSGCRSLIKPNENGRNLVEGIGHVRDWTIL